MLLALWNCVYFFKFQDILSDSRGPRAYYSQRSFLSSSITSRNLVRDKSKYQSSQRLCAILTAYYIMGLTFKNSLFWEVGDRDRRIEPPFHCGLAWRCLEVMERALGNIYISNPLYRPCRCQSRASSGTRAGGEQVALSTHADTEAALFSCMSGTSLWWLFYQRSCSAPLRLKPKEDDPHFLKAKCSVLISRDEVPLTRVNLLDPGRFIVSCHSWTHRTDLCRTVLLHTVCTLGSANIQRQLQIRIGHMTLLLVARPRKDTC